MILFFNFSGTFLERFLELFWNLSGTFSGTFLELFWNLFGIFKELFWSFSGTFFGTFLELFLEHLWNFFGTSLEFFGFSLDLLWNKYNDKDNPRYLWHLGHWLQFWQLITWIHDNLCYLTIKSDTEQHSQFLRCFYTAYLYKTKQLVVDSYNMFSINLQSLEAQIKDLFNFELLFRFFLNWIYLIRRKSFN